MDPQRDFNLTPDDRLAVCIGELYESQLPIDELSDAKAGLVGFFELLVQIDRCNEERPDEPINGDSDYTHKAP